MLNNRKKMIVKHGLQYVENPDGKSADVLVRNAVTVAARLSLTFQTARALLQVFHASMKIDNVESPG
jgi:hypothetical protein